MKLKAVLCLGGLVSISLCLTAIGIPSAKAGNSCSSGKSNAHQLLKSPNLINTKKTRRSSERYFGLKKTVQALRVKFRNEIKLRPPSVELAYTAAEIPFISILKHPQWGNVFCDPSSLCWSDVVRGDEDDPVETLYDRTSDPLELTNEEASAYCQNRQARLPSGDEVGKLYEWMGGEKQYRGGRFPVLLEEFIWFKDDEVREPEVEKPGSFFHNVHPVFSFNGSEGEIQEDLSWVSYNRTTRCAFPLSQL